MSGLSDLFDPAQIAAARAREAEHRQVLARNLARIIGEDLTREQLVSIAQVTTDDPTKLYVELADGSDFIVTVAEAE